MACGGEQFSPPSTAYGRKTCGKDCHDELALREASSILSQPYEAWSSKGNRPAAEVRLDPLEVSALRHIIHAQSPLEDTVGGLLRTVPQSHFKELSLDVLARKLGEWTPADGEPVRSLMGE